MRIGRSRRWSGKRLEELSLRDIGVNLLAIERDGRFAHRDLRPSARPCCRRGDVLLVDLFGADGRDGEALRAVQARTASRCREGGDYFVDRSQEVGMVEVMLPADSS